MKEIKHNLGDFVYVVSCTGSNNYNITCGCVVGIEHTLMPDILAVDLSKDNLKYRVNTVQATITAMDTEVFSDSKDAIRHIREKMKKLFKYAQSYIRIKTN